MQDIVEKMTDYQFMTAYVEGEMERLQIDATPEEVHLERFYEML